LSWDRVLDWPKFDIAEDNMNKRTQKVLLILVGVIVGIAAFSINSIGKKYAKQDPHPQQRETVTYVPEVVSCTPKVRVIKAEITHGETPNPVIVVEVENASEVGIIAISMESVKGNEAFENTLGSSFEGDQPPIVVIKPHEVGTLDMAMTSVFAGEPLRIGGVMYADGTEAGCERGLKTLHRARDYDKAKRRATK
jgi:hypothetical protein